MRGMRRVSRRSRHALTIDWISSSRDWIDFFTGRDWIDFFTGLD
jgi:hypothetical protein